MSEVSNSRGVRAAGRHNVVINDKELTTCDREPLQYIGAIQGRCGHVLTLDSPSGKILAHDAEIDAIPWLKAGAIQRDSEMRSNLIGGFLKDWVPLEVHEVVVKLMQDITKLKSQRNFQFQSINGSAFAITVSVASENYSTVGVEIEEMDPHDVSHQCLPIFVES